MRVFFTSILLLVSCTCQSHSVGNREETLYDSAQQRRLDVRIFYPARDGTPPQQQAANQVFAGFTASPDAPVATGRFPLIILSHGSGGNNRSLAWLAVPLAASGAVVVAANHPGSTTGDSSPATDLTLQTRDLSFLIAHYQQDPAWKAVIDAARTGAIGHSKGGYSVLALAGGRIDRARLTAYCRTMPQMPDCQFYQRDGVWQEKTDDARLAASYRDPRVRFVVALDPGMSYVFRPDSLAAINIPVLAIAAGFYSRPTGAMTLGVDTLRLPHITLPQAGHYDFLPLCQPQAQQILADEGEDFICDTPAAQRQAIHRQTVAAVLAFMHKEGFAAAR